MSIEARLQSVLDRSARDPQLTGIVAAIERPATGLCWQGHTGELDSTSRFVVASTTKLHTTAILLRLIERGDLHFDDRLVDVVSARAVDAMHVHRGVDRTASARRHTAAQAECPRIPTPRGSEG